MKKKVNAVPIQKRAMDKKRKIVQAGINLILKQGYYNTTTDDIAKEANVSVGTIYRYYSDKKEILMEGLSILLESMESTDFWNWDLLKSKEYDVFVYSLLNKFADFHMTHKSMHKELEILRHSDDDIAQFYWEFENYAVQKIINILQQGSSRFVNSKETAWLILQYIEAYCHLLIDEHNQNLDFDIIKNYTAKAILMLICKNK